MAGGGLRVPERELEVSEHGLIPDREDHIRRRCGDGGCLGRGRASCLHVAPMRLDQCARMQHHAAELIVPKRLRQVERRSGVLQGPLPPAREPLEHHEVEEHVSARGLVSAVAGVCRGHLQQPSGAFEVRHADQPPCERDRRALVELERDTQALFEFDAPLDEPRRDVQRPELCHRNARDRRREQCRVTDALGAAETVTGRAECAADIAHEQPHPAEEGQDPGAPSVVAGGLGKGLLAEAGDRAQIARPRFGEGKEHIGALAPGRGVAEQALQDRDGTLTVARQPMQRRSAQPAGALPRGGLRRRRISGELVELTGSGGRAAHRRTRAGPVEVRRHCRVRALGGEREVASPLLGLGDRAGEQPVDRTPAPERRRLVADGCEKRMDEADERPVKLEHT